MNLYQNYSTTDFHRKAEAVTSNIVKINQNVSSMTRMMNQLASASMANESSSAELRSQLHKITHYTGQLAKDTTEDLKDLNKFELNDQKELKLKREKLHSGFSEILNSFQTIQRTAAQKEKDILKSKKANQSVPFLEGPTDSQESAWQPRQDQRLQMVEDEESIELLRQRELAVRQLESDILDVNQIFKELATMVHDQGAFVDSIEANVESAQIQVEEGTRQLSTAHTYQNKARKKQCIIYLIAVIIVIIFGLIIYYS